MSRKVSPRSISVVHPLQLLKLGNIAGDDWFITTAHQRRILLHGEGDLHAGLNSLNYLLN